MVIPGRRENVLDTLIQEFQAGQGKLTQQTAFIARTNKPLVNTALQLMQNDVDFAIIGRDFSQELINFVQSITGKGKFRKNMPIQTFDAEIEKYTDEIRRKWSKRISKQGDLKESESISTSMMALISHLNLNGYHDKKLNMSIQNTDDFVEYIKKRFEGINIDTIEGKAQYDKLDPKGMVTLSTGHRSKGLEFERVFILAPNEYPHSKAKTPEQLEQEDNNWYVSLTRAMSELHILAPEEEKKQGIPGVE
jgi:superfamily I DNA/RNA helicase